MNKLASTLHAATHRTPGVPEHQDRPRGHQGQTHHGRSVQNRPPQNPGTTLNQAARVRHNEPPRVMVGWQNWIAGLFTRKTE